ncbi:hypothetical protein ACFXKG_23100 [Streptomyces sp. NPDC059255]|uniref:hypothetical protein n=1 Tax=Streptomyces sp. NPDC059255 TaxID=3346793 RepID=UPI0036B79C85
MGESVPVSCPSCGGGHTFTAPVYPCVCGAPVAPPLAAGAPVEPVTHRTWEDEWVTVRCAECGIACDQPRPELGCACGAVLRIPVRFEYAADPSAGAAEPAEAAPSAQRSERSEPVAPVERPRRPELPELPRRAERFEQPERPAHIPLPRTAASPRPAFRPLTIRTSHDAVTAAGLYLRWLGFKSVVQADERPASGIDLRGPDVIAQVDPTMSPASVRSVECLWLNGLNASAVSVYFSLAGYADDARARADDLGLPLFVMDLTGSPKPVNGPADELVSSGA